MLIVPLNQCRTEITIVNSRFIASLAPVNSVEEARLFIASIKKEFPQATHNVPAFIIGSGNTVTEFCSDDGEPSGTSGRPLLAVLKGSGLGNVCIVVTRYFGGTLLGTGGLVKAYSESGKLVLAITERAEMIDTDTVFFKTPYSLFEKIKVSLENLGSHIVKEDFAEEVSLTVDIASEKTNLFFNELQEWSSGKIIPEIIGTRKAPHKINVK